MRRPVKGARPRISQLVSFPAPSQGLISNRNLATPAQGGAAVCRNWFPTPQGPRLRRGLQRRATMIGEATVKSMFTYNINGGEKLFAATDEGIWDVSSVSNPYPQVVSPGGTDVVSDGTSGIGWYSVLETDNLWPATSGEWVTVQFSTAGGTFLIGVNGTDGAFIYDGTDFAAASISFPSGSTLTTADLTYVWVYKSRIWFAEKNSLNVWYLPVDQVGGDLELLPLGGVFNIGGSILFGSAWSLASGGDGGLSEQNVIVTTEGEVAVYQGANPSSASDWGKAGQYSIGKPLGKTAFIRVGGDLVIATSIGFIPLSKAIDLDQAALGLVAISNPIADTWRDMIELRGMSGYVCEMWGEGSMTLIATPTPDDQPPLMLVVNTDNGAWCDFTNWNPTCMEIFKGRLYLGGVGGKVQEAWVGGVDEQLPYTGTLIPLFDDLGMSGQRKVAKIARVVRRSSYPTAAQIVARFDWHEIPPSPPDAVAVPVGNEWDNAIWNESVWNTERNAFIGQEWVSLGGSGYAVSVCIQVTSGVAVPLDVEIARIDYTYDVADIIS